MIGIPLDSPTTLIVHERRNFGVATMNFPPHEMIAKIDLPQVPEITSTQVELLTHPAATRHARASVTHPAFRRQP
jgi:hypothetical protein